MFRLRRYRVFLVFAIIATALLYHFRSLGDLTNAGAPTVEGLKNLGHKAGSLTNKVKTTPVPGIDDKLASHPLVDSGPAKNSAPTVTDKPSGIPVVAGEPTSSKEDSKSISTSRKGTQPSHAPSPSHLTTKASIPVGTLDFTPYGHPNTAKPVPVTSIIADPIDLVHGKETGAGRLEEVEDTAKPKIRWSAQPEHFPVPTSSLIQLPSGTPKNIPKIQHDFKSTKTENAAQSDKLDTIKKAFTYSWAGYREKAWMQDELSPKSGKHRNTLCGWGATLVDSLDTLWIMELKDEFEEAVNALKNIDFTISNRNDIPIFETVIRYLGGLIGAYDISGATYRVLLDKAVELADILMGAFDTPNRMPITYYYWKPAFASQPHRAKSKVVLAELGSLSLEFTRLAQITKEPMYYDAVARITNELEIWQNSTKLPGLWPLKVDASGCKRIKVSSSALARLSKSTPTTHKPTSLAEKAAANRAAAVRPDDAPILQNLSGQSELEDAEVDSDEASGEDAEMDAFDITPLSVDVDASDHAAYEDRSALPPQGGILRRRGVSIERESASKTKQKGENKSTQLACEPQGLTSAPFSELEEFTIGGQADSVYEYLPKEYVLLGGLEPRYRSMYEMAADSSKKHLIYRPMIPDETRSILQAGLLRVSGKEKSGKERKFQPEGAHLTCFAGGMFALGAKVFERKEDIDIAKKLTDGCVWAYEATNTGIMPEAYLSIACKDSQSCPWNETLWKEELDPYGAQREEHRLEEQKQHVLSDKKTPQTMPPKEAADATIAIDSEKAAYRASFAKQSPTVLSPSSTTGEKKDMKTDGTTVVDRAASAESDTKPNNPNGDPSTNSKSNIDITTDSLKDGDEKVLETDIAVGVTKETAALAASKSSTDRTPLSSSAIMETDNSASTTNGPSVRQGLPKLNIDDSNSVGTGSLEEQLKKRQLDDFDKMSPGNRQPSAESHREPTKLPSNVVHDDWDSSDEHNINKPQPTIAPVNETHSKNKSNEVVQKNGIGGSSKNSDRGSKDAALSAETVHNTHFNALSSQAAKDVHPAPTVNRTQLASQYATPKIPTREEFISAKIKDERLPIGMTGVTGRKYLLR